MLPLPDIRGLRKAYKAEEVMPNRYARTLKTMVLLYLAARKNKKSHIKLGGSYASAIDTLAKKVMPQGTEWIAVSPEIQDGGAPFRIFIEPQYYTPMELKFLDAVEAFSPDLYSVLTEIITAIIGRCPCMSTMNTAEFAMDWIENGESEDMDRDEAIREAEQEQAFFGKHFPRIYRQHLKQEEPLFKPGTLVWETGLQYRIKDLLISEPKKKWLLEAIRIAQFWSNFEWKAPLVSHSDLEYIEGAYDRPSLDGICVFYLSFGTQLAYHHEEAADEFWMNNGTPVVVAEPKTADDLEFIKTFIKELQALCNLFHGGHIWTRKKKTKTSSARNRR